MAGLDPESPAVIKTIEVQQDVIARMSSSSSSLKSWCVTVVTGIIVFAADKGEWTFVLLAVIPSALFCAMDIYYLSMERSFRDQHADFVRKLIAGEASTADLYTLRSVSLRFKDTCTAARSPSIWVFYLMLILSLLVTGSLLSSR